jgi:hypothetical protein
MPIPSVLEAEPAEQLPTQPETRRAGGRLRRFLNRIKLGLGGNNEELVLQNKTGIAWCIYQRRYSNDVEVYEMECVR